MRKRNFIFAAALLLGMAGCDPAEELSGPSAPTRPRFDGGGFAGSGNYVSPPPSENGVPSSPPGTGAPVPSL